MDDQIYAERKQDMERKIDQALMVEKVGQGAGGAVVIKTVDDRVIGKSGTYRSRITEKGAVTGNTGEMFQSETASVRSAHTTKSDRKPVNSPVLSPTYTPMGKPKVGTGKRMTSTSTGRLEPVPNPQQVVSSKSSSSLAALKADGSRGMDTTTTITARDISPTPGKGGRVKPSFVAGTPVVPSTTGPSKTVGPVVKREHVSSVGGGLARQAAHVPAGSGAKAAKSIQK